MIKTMSGKIEEAAAFKAAAVLMIGTAVYGTLFFALGDVMLPSNEMWSLLLIWTASHIGALIVKMAHLPPLLGMLLSGLVLKNLPGGIIDGLPESWSASLRAGALSIILLRSGLELDIGAFKRVGAVAVRLTCSPGLVEAVTVGAVSIAIFSGMNFFLGLSTGFIMAAVSPAVVVSGMFDLQRKGYGVSKGIPSLVVAAASFDDVLAITGYSLFIGLAIPSGSLIWSIAHGPLSITLGLIGGCVAGLFLACTKIWSTPMWRVLATFIAAMFVMYTSHHFHFTSAGAMGSLMLGITANWAWSRGWPAALSQGPDDNIAHEVESLLARFWALVAQPMLFGLIGSSVDFGEINAGTIPKAVLLTAVGSLVRLPTALLVTYGADLTWRERIFVALSWLPKATVQAALGSGPLDMVESTMECHREDYDVLSEYEDCIEKYERYEQYGKDILTTAVFCIILTAPLGLIFINKLGTKMLSQDKVVIPSESMVNLMALDRRTSQQIPEPPSAVMGDSALEADSEGAKEGGKAQPPAPMLGRLSLQLPKKPSSLLPHVCSLERASMGRRLTDQLRQQPTGLFGTRFPVVAEELERISQVAETVPQAKGVEISTAVFAIKKQLLARSALGYGGNDEMDAPGRFFRLASATTDFGPLVEGNTGQEFPQEDTPTPDDSGPKGEQDNV